MGEWSSPYDALAASKLPKAERAGFRVYLYEAVDSGVLLTGTWPTRVYSRGPRKGQPDYNSGIKAKGTRTVAVTRREYHTAAEASKALVDD